MTQQTVAPRPAIDAAPTCTLALHRAIDEALRKWSDAALVWKDAGFNPSTAPSMLVALDAHVIVHVRAYSRAHRMWYSHVVIRPQPCFADADYGYRHFGIDVIAYSAPLLRFYLFVKFSLHAYGGVTAMLGAVNDVALLDEYRTLYAVGSTVESTDPDEFFRR